jgi:phage/plasmid-like protein (TIGR03299 family)
MSQETSVWLNTMTLIGFTDKRGTAWHYRESEQGERPNHYPGAIPEADVIERLFDWEPEVGFGETTVRRGGQDVRIVDTSRKTIVHPKTDAILGQFMDSYQPHGYKQWLLTNLRLLLQGGGLGLSSAGLLKAGAQGWVQAELEETQEVAGIQFRPFVTAFTSLDGSLATNYITGAQLVVCDNTLGRARSSAAAKYRVKHSSRSLGRIPEIQDALGLASDTADEITSELENLIATDVDEKAWQRFLDLEAPVPADLPKGRKRTNAENHRDALINLYHNDLRVQPWAGTAFGVVQAVNTYDTHVRTVKGSERAERNADKMVTGAFGKLTADTIEKVNLALVA